MKVSELISALQQYDKNIEVKIWGTDDTYGEYFEYALDKVYPREEYCFDLFTDEERAVFEKLKQKIREIKEEISISEYKLRMKVHNFNKDCITERLNNEKQEYTKLKNELDILKKKITTKPVCVFLEVCNEN